MCFVLHYEVKRNPCCPLLTTLVSGSLHNQGNSHREARLSGRMPQIAPRRFAVGANTVRSTKGAQRTCADRSIIQNGKRIAPRLNKFPVLFDRKTLGIRLQGRELFLRSTLCSHSARGTPTPTHCYGSKSHNRLRHFHTPCELRRFAAALRALLRFRSARGAICARSLTSKLVDSASLDY